MTQLFFKHIVSDFDQWKSIYDSLKVSSDRQTLGFVGSRIMRGQEDPNLVVVLEYFETLDGAKSWASSSDLSVAMGHAGVTSASEIHFLENVT